MCRRYTPTSDLHDYQYQLKLEFLEELLHPRLYNIAPSQPVVGLVADPVPRVEVMEWGFLPGQRMMESSNRSLTLVGKQ
ncbi:MAG: hypothetical protein J4G05_10585 [Chlorobi bacterium]|nr:hypothetical protein [Chlorobiota bacterium]